MNNLRNVRGTKDLFGEEYLIYDYIVKIAEKLSQDHGFVNVQTPIFEFTELFKRSLGDSSDIVIKEMYNFEDKKGKSLTLRPEFTASICRFIISNSLSYQLPMKIFTYGPLFRYERPQKGRQRQFHQINFEAIGYDSSDIDAEIIGLSKLILEKLSVKAELQINSVGCIETRNNYKNSLREYFEKYINDLSEDSKIRLERNILRILDSKDEKDREIIADAPIIEKFYSKKSRENFHQLLNKLENLGIKYSVNNRLVRGLDYYNDTVFEWVNNDELGAQSAICGGGRYDNLFKIMTGSPKPAFGFAAGIERLMLLASFESSVTKPVSLIAIGEKSHIYSFKLAYELRKNGLNIHFEYDDSVGKQMQKASKNSSIYVIIIGEEELEMGKAKIKNFSDGKEEFLELDKIKNFVTNIQCKKNDF